MEDGRSWVPIYFSNYGLSMTRECYVLNLVQIGRAVDTTFKLITSMQYIYEYV